MQPSEGSIFYSKKIRTYVVYAGDPTDGGLGYYAPINPTIPLSQDEVGDLEPVVRFLHFDRAMARAETFVAALTEAKQIYGPSAALSHVSKAMQG